MQGFNMGRYVPPDAVGLKSGNSLHNRRAPGVLRKDGTQTVRFEMPFAVWCHHCTPHQIIGQGVRFNAIKKKIGNYFSTPIWQFDLKHVACGGVIIIKTDPKNAAYVVVEGGKARDYGDEGKVLDGADGRQILTVEERERRREDAFAALEGKKEDQALANDQTKRFKEIYRERERDWQDPFEVNRKLRSTFRAERKVREKEAKEVEGIQDRLGTEIEILPATEEDEQRARLVAFENGQESGLAKLSAQPFLKPASHKPLYSRREGSSTGKVSAPRTRKHNHKIDRKEILQRHLIGNTRAAMNPFGSSAARPS